MVGANPLYDRATFCGSGSGSGGGGGGSSSSTCELVASCTCRDQTSSTMGSGICGAKEQRAAGDYGAGSHCFNHLQATGGRRQGAADETAARAPTATTAERVGGGGCQRFLDNFLIGTTPASKKADISSNNTEHNKWQSAEQSDKMAQKRYYVSLLCLVLIIVACLLASFVISRSVGLGDLEADSDLKSGQQLQLRSDPRAQVPMELRSVDLVDLIECDKTFAYTRWRVQVQVPKSSPIYRQRPPFLSGADSKQAPTTTTLSNPTGDEQQVASLAPPPSPQNIAVDDKLQARTSQQESSKSRNEDSRDEADEEQADEELDDGSRYHLTSTSQFVARANNGTSGREAKGDDQQNRRGARQVTATVAGGVVAQPTLQPEEPVIDFYDPVRAMAAELGLSTSSLNRTVVDCFFVDTEKRYNQKILIEDRHRSVANTRRVPFDQMMEALKACRALTWASLSSRRPAGGSLSVPTAPSQRQSVSSQDQPATEASEKVVAPVQVLHPTGLQTKEIVKRQVDMSQLASNGAGGAPRTDENMILTMIQAWIPQMGGAQAQTNQLTSLSQTIGRPDEVSSASGESVRPDESRQRTSTIVPTPVVIPATARAGPGHAARGEDQANRVSYITMGMSMVSGIVPNTLWCGLGDKAANYSELGAEYKIDSCCRAHDHCPIRLRPFASDYGIINLSMSTRSHCGCDLDFNNCLAAINTTLSNVIKNLYFRFVGLQCIDIESKQLTDQPINESILARDQM